jgi:Bacterial membrane protein YfhO
MGRARRFAAGWAGPLLIVVCVAFALRGFVGGGSLSGAHPDLLTFWLPRWAFLGRSLAEGHIPLWNPFEMAGYRFAADPQSGWLYLPPMALFSTLGPVTALNTFIVFNPLMAGLGLYGFLRIETLSRPAATAGGLSLAMMMAASTIAVSLPFAGTLAWTPIVLLAAAGYRHTRRWSRRLLWMALGGVAWSQVASAHLSHGLMVCSILVASYLVVGAVSDARTAAGNLWQTSGRVALSVAPFLIFLPVAALPVLIPRLAFIGASSLHGGYAALGDASGTAPSGAPGALITNGVWAGWPLAFGSAPGAYAGAAILLAVPLALRAGQRRVLVWAFAVALAVTYLLMLNLVVTAGWFRTLIGHVPFGDVYLHNPGRLRYLAVVAVPVLGAVGIQGLVDRPMAPRRVALWLAGGTALWLLVPLAGGAIVVRYAFLAACLPFAVVVLTLLALRRTTWALPAVVGVLALELLASAAFGQIYQGGTVLTGMEGGRSPNISAQPLPVPHRSAAAYLRTPASVAVLRATPERYLTWAPPAAYYQKGYLFMQDELDYGALAMERGTLFGVRDALGYNPVQLPRYWAYLRAANPLPMYYNAAVVNLPSLSLARMLGVRYLTVPDGVASPLPGHSVVDADGYQLIEVDGWEPRASVLSRWTVAPGAKSLLAVTAPGFDPARDPIVLTHDLGIPPPAIAGARTATYREISAQDVVVNADTPANAIVLVRTSFDAGWSATVDGRPAPVVPADYLLQGVPIPAGRHTVELTYHDPEVTRGLQAGLIVWVLFAIALVATLLTERRRRSRAPPKDPRPA